MSKLYLIRHSEVIVESGTAPEQWHLSETGRKKAAALAEYEHWTGVHTVYHSPQPKTKETAAFICAHTGAAAKEMAGLGEVWMNGGFLEHEHFVQRIGDYLRGTNEDDFESFTAATDRIVTSILHIVRQLNGESAAIVSHGRILSVFFSYLLGRRVTVEEWQSMRFPELSVIDVNTWRIERGFLASPPVRQTGP